MSKFEFILFWQNRAIHINRNLNGYFNRYLHLNSLFYFNRSIDIDRLINVDRFLDYSGNLNSFDYFSCLKRWDFLLHFNVLGHFNYLFDNPFRPWDILGDLDLHLDRFLNNNFLDNFLCSLHIDPFNLVIFLSKLSLQCIEIDFKFILLALQLSYYLVIVASIFGHPSVILQLHFQLHVLFLSRVQFLCQFVYFLEQFLQTLFILTVILLNLDLYLFVTAWCVWGWDHQVLSVHSFFHGGDLDRYKGLHLLLNHYSFILNCATEFLLVQTFTRGGQLWVLALLLLDDDRLLDAQLLSAFWLAFLHLNAEIGTWLRPFAIVRFFNYVLFELAHFVLEIGCHSNSLLCNNNKYYDHKIKIKSSFYCKLLLFITWK